MNTVKQLCVVANTGNAVVLYVDGSIRRQRPSMDLPNQTEWELLSTTDLPSRITEIGVDFGGRVTVLLRDGSLHKEIPARAGEFRRVNTWKAIEGPKE